MCRRIASRPNGSRRIGCKAFNTHTHRHRNKQLTSQQHDFKIHSITVYGSTGNSQLKSDSDKWPEQMTWAREKEKEKNSTRTQGATFTLLTAPGVYCQSINRFMIGYKYSVITPDSRMIKWEQVTWEDGSRKRNMNKTCKKQLTILTSPSCLSHRMRIW